MAFTFDRERVKQKIALVRDKISKEANPQLLNDYRLLFKKELSFFRRSWASAYLLMLYDQGQQNSRWERDEGPRTRRGPAPEEGPRAPSRDTGTERRIQGALAEAGGPGRFVLSEEESKRIFISIGRNRRLFPREILGLIISATQVEREDIGSIRILDSYSFVQVRSTVADQIIEALNGTMFRGRTLAVNYAHAKRDGEGGRGEGAEGPEAAARDEPTEIAESAEITESPAGAESVENAEDVENAESAPPEEAPASDLGAEEADDLPDKEDV
jgi:hypothetical protein